MSSTRSRRSRIAGFSILVLLACGPALAEARHTSRADLDRRLAGLTIPFVANEGQTDPRVAFSARTFAGAVFVTRAGEIVYALPKPGTGGWVLTERLLGGEPGKLVGIAPSATRVGSFVGKDPQSWTSSAPTYGSISLGSVWPGVEVSLSAHGRTVEKIFRVAPGASGEAIRLAVSGAEELTLAQGGSLAALTGLGTVSFSPPVAYQKIGGRRVPVEVAYTIRGREYGFRLGRYDRSLPVVIDPILQSTYLGGSGGEGTTQDDPTATIAIHPTTGDVYVAGHTSSLNFPGTTGGAQPTLNPNTTGGQDAFVARLNSTLTTLLQATYLGGSSIDFALAILVHPTSGEIYVGGSTNSSDFPMTAGGAVPTGGGNRGFVSRLNAGLTSILQSTYSANGSSHVAALAVRANGEVYAGGEILTGTIPNTTGGAQPSPGGDVDAFLMRLNSALTSILQATYLGGTSYDGFAGAANSSLIADGGGIAVHPTTGDVYAAGETNSFDFPGTTGGAQPVHNNGTDAFIARLNGDLTSLLQATYLGGSTSERARDVAVHPTTGEVYITGEGFQIADFPNTAGGAQPTGGLAFNNGFIARLNAALTTNPQSTYFAGGNTDLMSAIAIHPVSGEVYVGGLTASTGMPGTAGGAQPTLGNSAGTSDGIATRLNAALTAFIQSTYFGGSSADAGFGEIAFHPTTGDFYGAGEMGSTNMPGVAGGAQGTFGGGGEDAFAVRMTADLAGAGGGLTPTPPTPTLTPTITTTPPLTPGGPTSTPTPTLTSTLTPTLSPTIIGGGPGGPTAPIPTLAPWTMAILALALAGIGYLVLRSRS